VKQFPTIGETWVNQNLTKNEVERG